MLPHRSSTTKLTLQCARACPKMVSHCSMVMPSVTCHSPSVAANNTTEELHFCFYRSHDACGIWDGVGGGWGSKQCQCAAIESTIGIHVHIRSITLGSCIFDTILTNCLSVMYTLKSSSFYVCVFQFAVSCLKGPC